MALRLTLLKAEAPASLSVRLLLAESSVALTLAVRASVGSKQAGPHAF